jgi:hypothetical protein
MLGLVSTPVYNTALKSAAICSSIHSAFFDVNNLVGVSFCNHDDSPITDTISTDPSTHPSEIYFSLFAPLLTPSLMTATFSSAAPL